MPLTCGCKYCLKPGMIIFYDPDDFEPLNTNLRKRCQSCKKLINPGDLSLSFDRYKIPESDIEERIYGEGGEIPRAPHYLCEKCGEIYFNLSAGGFECVDPHENMPELLKEYQDTYKPQKL